MELKSLKQIFTIFNGMTLMYFIINFYQNSNISFSINFDAVFRATVT